MERERDVILQEIAAAHDAPDDLVFDLAQAASYGDHPLGRSILGPARLIETVNREQMIAWRDRNYWASRIVVGAAGGIDHQVLAREAEKLFGGLQRGQAPQRQSPVFNASAQTEAKPLDQTHIVLGFPAPNYRDPRIYQLQVLSSVLGGGMSSRLFQEVREKRGLCYSVFSYGTSYEDVGQLGVYAATSPEHTPELIDVAANVMLSIGRDVTAKEVDRAKAQLKTSLVMNLESASARADQVARQFLAFGEVPDVGTLVKRIEAVCAEDVRTLAEEVFTTRRPSLSAVGQLSGLANYTDIAARFSTRR
jgi:predicted Zn-dependent peptidase